MFVGARFSLLVALCLLVAGGLAARAQAQDRFPATVPAVVDGDTLDAQVTGGPALEVQVIGIDAPEPDDCGGEQAIEHMKQLALGRSVTLVSDPIIEQFAPPGNRPLFYVDRDDGRTTSMWVPGACSAPAVERRCGPSGVGRPATVVRSACR
jgi:hypothetical protein